MPTVKEMAEAHLLNVQNEIQNVDRKIAELNNERERMITFLNEGLAELQAINGTMSDDTGGGVSPTDSEE